MVDFVSGKIARLKVPNIVIDCDWSFSFGLKEKDTQQPINLTGVTALMHIRETVDGPLLHELSTQNGKIVINAELGEITLSLADTETSAITWTKAVFAIRLQNLDGFDWPLCKGSIKSERVAVYD